ncbi:MAG: hypothetical protein AAFX44_20115 [Pseudomonadota bacterium]
MHRSVQLVAVLVLAGSGTPALSRGLDVRPQISLEARAFAADAQFPDQLDTAQFGVILSGDASWRSDDRRTRFDVEPYLRIDSEDSRRGYVDIRELSVAHDFGEWDLVFGISQVFWGVAESRNVVDVVNQFDTLEGIDEDEKLGQPMLRASRKFGRGNIELLYLPYFREREFPGSDGRLRFTPVVDDDSIVYERGGDEWAGDWAARYSQRAGALDLGVHVFHGTSRNPFLALAANGDALVQNYQTLQQYGVDTQYTNDAWLLKGEYVRANISGERFSSVVAGFEYTVFGIAGTPYDLGLIAEYLRDTRDLDRAPITVFDNDVFAGTRLTLNDSQDTELLAGAIVEADNGAIQWSIEFRRRLGTRSLIEIEARGFSGSGDPFVEAFESDDYLLVRWTHYF